MVKMIIRLKVVRFGRGILNTLLIRVLLLPAHIIRPIQKKSCIFHRIIGSSSVLVMVLLMSQAFSVFSIFSVTNSMCNVVNGGYLFERGFRGFVCVKH
jgi:hypothetical protein